MKVLILAYDFPPLVSIGGHRPFSWFKYFQEAGAEVTVITRFWDANTQKPEDYVCPTEQVVSEEASYFGKIIRTPYSPNLRDRFLLKFGFTRYIYLRKVLSVFYAFLEYLSFAFDSKSKIYKQAETFLRSNQVDLIIATGGPFQLFKYGYYLSKRFNIPWVADYRDGWTTNQGGYRNSLPDKVLNRFYKCLEQKYLRNVFFITTAAPAYAELLREIHPDKEVNLVYNGYFEDYHNHEIADDNINDEFTVSYMGTIYPYQKIEMFLEGLRQFLLLQPEAKIRLNLFGLNPGVQERIEKNGADISSHIFFYGKVSHQESIQRIRQSNLLLLLSAAHVNTLASKVFDYLAAKRTIILVENDLGILNEILTETQGGLSFSKAQDICAFLQKEYQRYVSNNYKNYSRSSQNIAFYSRKNQAELLLNIMIQKLALKA